MAITLTNCDSAELSWTQQPCVTKPRSPYIRADKRRIPLLHRQRPQALECKAITPMESADKAHCNKASGISSSKHATLPTDNNVQSTDMSLEEPWELISDEYSLPMASQFDATTQTEGPSTLVGFTTAQLAQTFILYAMLYGVYRSGHYRGSCSHPLTLETTCAACSSYTATTSLHFETYLYLGRNYYSHRRARTQRHSVHRA